jgi:two-component system sensor histidine kinase/response regulator
MKIPYWEFLLGKNNGEIREQRALHAVTLVSMILLLVITPFNYLLGLSDLVYISVVYFFIAFFGYYSSRFRNKPQAGMIMYQLLCLGYLVVCFFYNSGLSGPAIILSLMLFSFVVVLDKKENYFFWTGVHIVLVITLLLIEYFWPELIRGLYRSRKEQFLDIAIGAVITLSSVGYLGRYLRDRYEHEKEEVEIKSLKINEINQILEQSNQTKNKILSIISHDLRSPIASIQSYLSMIHEVPLDAEERKNIEQHLLLGVQSTSDLLDNLLSWVKLESKAEEIRKEKVDMFTALHSILQIYQPVASLKNIRLSMSCSEKAQAAGDPHMIYFIIRNLVNNAVKFTPTGGLVRVKCLEKADRIQVEIIDNGIGMDQSQVSNLFSGKSGSRGTKGEPGLGMGMRLVQEFIELMEGTLFVESSPGKGSSFLISLPRPGENDISG